jgi:hypothetical protein
LCIPDDVKTEAFNRIKVDASRSQQIVNLLEVVLMCIEGDDDHAMEILSEFKLTESIMGKKPRPVNYKLIEDIVHSGTDDDEYYVIYVKNEDDFQ